MRAAHIDVCGTFEPGDPPPDGYMDWHEWADAQYKAGHRQKQCGRCALWKFPQELSREIDRFEAQTSRGKKVVIESPVCEECSARRSQVNAHFKSTQTKER